jgi:hypothetical protein
MKGTSMLRTESATGLLDEPADEPADEVQDITRHILFATISVHWWRGTVQIPNAKIVVDGEAVDEELASQSSYHFMPEQWRQRFNQMEKRARDVFTRASPKGYPVKGLTVIPAARAGELFAHLNHLIASQFEPLVEEFLTAWPILRDQQLAKLTPVQRAEIDSAVPTNLQALRRKFRVDQYVIPVTGSGGNTLDGTAAAAYAGAVQARAQAFLDETARSITSALSQELLDAVDNLAQRLNDKGVVRGGTLDSVRRAFDKIKGFGFAANPEVLERIQEVEAQLNVTPQALNRDNRDGDQTITDTLVESLRRLRRAGEEEMASRSRFGRGLRAIDVG